MARRSTWITNLRKYARATEIPDEEGPDVSSEISGESDRVAVILQGSHLEDTLEKLIAGAERSLERVS
jgi:hypothetical protein